MAITKDKKRDIVTKLTSAFAEATGIAFVGFTKLSVKDASALRTDLSGKGVKYFVAKKTLIRRALTERGYAGEIPDLPGEVAVAWTTHDDTTVPVRSIFDFGKKLKGALSLLGGVFEGSFQNASEAVAMATIPPLPVLRGMFANLINSPRQRFAIALNEVAKTK
jgi:ribosomal protein L10